MNANQMNHMSRGTQMSQSKMSQDRKSQPNGRVALFGVGTALAVMLAFAFQATQVASAGGGYGFGGDEFGSLPGTGGGAWNFARPDVRARLTLEAADTAAGLAAIIGPDGPGEIVVEELASGRVLFRFYGPLRVDFDEAKLADTDLQFGVTASSAGDPVLTQLLFAQVATTPLVLRPGGFLELPVERMHNAGLLDESVRIRTFQQKQVRAAISLSSHQGILSAFLTD